MDSCIESLANHPIVIMVIAAAALFMIYFMLVKFFKMVLIIGLILLACTGYLYYRSPGDFAGNMRKTVETVMKNKDKMIATGKKVISESRELTDGIEKVVERGKKVILGE
ncbi:MAG: hypothetical protein JXB42_02155 [Deltaproteobacteria bacterium]|nr:hypothetical protein [Deltaproteobacteria bacterium]